ncbi:class I SAM-dependent methyltransferase [Croceicoccus sp. Ery15]|uniref:class I SAM-dependent methyltransferase n=1 Tax=Croceicoccus sp. Ery15 TaxID=1703338 RepID=UPI001E4CA815|nr:methyltransferase domain-containing protein [Croceicoccus sp. Ery15]
MQTASVAAAYDKWAPIYDLVFGNVFATGRALSIAAAEQVGGRILEVGVGTGISLPRYSKDVRLVGVDISDSMLDKARERTRRLNLENVEQIRVMDAEAMDFATGEFDVVVAQYVVTAVPNPEKALDEFLRVLRPGGEIVITTRISADKGVRDRIEKMLMPVTSKLGWRTEFPWERYEAWAARTPGVQLVERRALPPLGHFSLVRYQKVA